MNKDLIAKAATTIEAPVAKVWDALVTPDAIKQYMFGTTAISDWNEGSPMSADGASTRVSLSQDNSPTEQAREEYEKNWGAMLGGLKKYLED